MKLAILASLAWAAMVLVYVAGKAHPEAKRLVTSTKTKPLDSTATNIIAGGDEVDADVNIDDNNASSDTPTTSKRMTDGINPNDKRIPVSVNADMPAEAQVVEGGSKTPMPLLTTMRQNDAIPGYIEYVPIPPSAYFPLTGIPSGFDSDTPSGQISSKGLPPGHNPRMRLAARWTFPFGLGNTGQQQHPSPKPTLTPRPQTKHIGPRKTPKPKTEPRQEATSPPTTNTQEAPDEPTDQSKEPKSKSLETAKPTSPPKKDQTKTTPQLDTPLKPTSKTSSPSKLESKSISETERDYQPTEATPEHDESKKPTTPKPKPKNRSPKKPTSKQGSPTKPEPKILNVTGTKTQSLELTSEPDEQTKPPPLVKKSPAKTKRKPCSSKKPTTKQGSPKKRKPEPRSTPKPTAKPRSRTKPTSSTRGYSGSWKRRPRRMQPRIRTCFCSKVPKSRERCYSFTNLKTGECRSHRCPAKWRCVAKGYSKNICIRKIKTARVELIPGSHDTCRKTQHRPKAYLVLYKHLNVAI